MANIELPNDAEGREIPLDTSEIFIADGTMVHVVKFEYMYYTCDARGSWFVHFNRTSGEHMTLQPCDVHLTPPDSWKKLEDDLDRGANALNYESCAYFGKSACDCSSCIADKGKTCERVAMRDIASRIRKLRGEE
jgi:hypothetical protein